MLLHLRHRAYRPILRRALPSRRAKSPGGGLLRDLHGGAVPGRPIPDVEGLQLVRDPFAPSVVDQNQGYRHLHWHEAEPERVDQRPRCG